MGGTTYTWLLLWLVAPFSAPAFASAFVHPSPSSSLEGRPRRRQHIRRSLLVLPSDIVLAQRTKSTDQRCAYDDLTILLPAYNESDRITETLLAYSSYISTHHKEDVVGTSAHPDSLLSIDILVVDDGSTDDTAGAVRQYSEFNPILKTSIDCISLPHNEGKGGAIERGIEEIARRKQQSFGNDDKNQSISDDRTSLVLVADADGSGDLSCLGDMLHTLNNLLVNQQTQALRSNEALIVGNRGYDGAGIARIVLRWGFRTAVKIICGDLEISDTQCGMKLMTLDAANTLYRNLNLRRWSHDVEVLYRAKILGVPVAEVPVKWEDKDGSKLVTSAGGTIGASIRMLLEIMHMRMEYALGRWQVN
eukprot:CAMPEP_0197717614 /NCGR_PEP_ID=MMETSP1434-20131217/2095_1 /TAXON_ID=265543 /ORGANISM="Minutocellus polymorphus, Strain CCMP3303" /LENGTH=362 /DNA_ID=CAMNT_0043302171 /DNA_START=88 /DNA_END=1176 /DNA_ORIENTATION=+